MEDSIWRHLPGDGAGQLAGGEGGEPGSEALTPPDEHDGNDLDVIEVTVNVINVKEDGSVVFYPSCSPKSAPP